MNGPQIPSSTAAEAGRLDALSRRKASSAHPSYRAGYLDGLFERASQHVAASFRDRTINGMVIEAIADADGARYWLRDASGRLVTEGTAIDIEMAVAGAEGDLRSLGQPTARLSEITATIRTLDPTLSDDAVQRVATKAAAFMVEFRESGQR
jgi:hypothetical protein